MSTSIVVAKVFDDKPDALSVTEVVCPKCNRVYNSMKELQRHWDILSSTIEA